jgi:LysR family glycine cleavage system transcriptional activator
MTLDAGWYLVWPRRPRQQAPVMAVRDWLLAQVSG